VAFETSEPASVYYTTDGSRPTLDSPRYKATEFREPGEKFHVTETTTFGWFSVDTPGNVEGGYDPAKPAARGKFREATITIAGT
jgi:Chitobiase/beta-hexosaminidase C-terminal domain